MNDWDGGCGRVAELAASLVHSGVRLDDEEYVKVLKRLLEVGMLEYPLKLSAVWKVVGKFSGHRPLSGVLTSVHTK